MENLKKFVEDNPDKKRELMDFLKLAERKEGGGVVGLGPKKLILVGSEETVNKDYKTKEDIPGFNLFFTEEGEKKKYFIPKLGRDEKIHYLVEMFSNISEGAELVLEYKKKDGSYEGYISVETVGEKSKAKKEIKNDDEINVSDIPF